MMTHNTMDAADSNCKTGGGFWRSASAWRRSAKNTAWCLLGCGIGDLGTIGLFQIFAPTAPVALVMALAMLNGLITSILLETAILMRGGMAMAAALKTALGMSFIAMLTMEAAMNTADYLVAGGARLTVEAVPIALAAGFLTPWPYNYWRLRKFGTACH